MASDEGNAARLELPSLQLGPWPMNCYVVRCPATGKAAIVDPGADAEAIGSRVAGMEVVCILLTHGHPDHVGALASVREATRAPVGIHPFDAQALDLEADFPLLDGMEVTVGNGRVRVAHVPGHTPGSVCLLLNGVAIVGDAIFPGGPGHTDSPEALARSLLSLGRTVFCWPDATELHPGHGEGTTVGAERAAFERFLLANHAPDLHGDVSWR